jgi:hypothetical protein
MDDLDKMLERQAARRKSYKLMGMSDEEADRMMKDDAEMRRMREEYEANKNRNKVKW